MSFVIVSRPAPSFDKSGMSQSSAAVNLDSVKASENRSTALMDVTAAQRAAKPVQITASRPEFQYPNPADVRVNEVNVGGVTIEKYPSQTDLTTVRTGAAYPSAALNKLKPTVYVIDGFDQRTVPVGAGAQRVMISHGDYCASIIKAGLPTVKVVKLEAGAASGGMNLNAVGQRIDEVIAREAKLQGTSKPDLSRVFISMSVGESKPTALPYKFISAPMARFTQLGGTLYASAGNELLNTTGSLPGVGVVYATQAVSGATLSNSPAPAQSLASGSASLGNGSTSMIPINRIDASSRSYVGAGTLPQRYNPTTKAVENQNAQGQWVPAVAADRVSASPVPGMAKIGPLDNLKPSRVLTLKDIAQFGAWRASEDAAACAKHKMPAGSTRTATLNDLSESELNGLDMSATQEFRARFGATSVMTIAEFKTSGNISQSSDRSVLLDQMLPAGLNAKTTFIPAEAALFGTNKPDAGSTHFYRRDPSGAMRHAVSYNSSGVSTSAATPDVVVRAVQDRADRLVKAEAKRQSFGK